VNICLVGYGAIARVHLRALSEEQVALHTVVGRLSEPCAEFAREFGFQRYTADLDEALSASDIDAVIITSPTDLHFEHAEKALRAGKHVLCEIPLATNLSHVDRLIALSTESGCRLMACHTQRYMPGFVLAHQLISEGKLHVHHIVYRSIGLRRENVGWTGRRRSWADNLLWHHGCHLVDTALWLLGATDVEVDGHVSLPGKALGIPMDLAIVLRTPLDQLVTIVMSYNARLGAGDCLIIGEEDTLLYAKGRLTTRDRTLYEPPANEDGLAAAVRSQDREFLAAIRKGREPAVSGATVRPAMAVLQAVQDQFSAWAPSGAVHPIG
jgi:2-hydroxy-4-carboxymuconate semialdehyde hemiacetal dehydrogenase